MITTSATHSVRCPLLCAAHLTAPSVTVDTCRRTVRLAASRRSGVNSRSSTTAGCSKGIIGSRGITGSTTNRRLRIEQRTCRAVPVARDRTRAAGTASRGTASTKQPENAAGRLVTTHQTLVADFIRRTHVVVHHRGRGAI